MSVTAAAKAEILRQAGRSTVLRVDVSDLLLVFDLIEESTAAAQKIIEEQKQRIAQLEANLDAAQRRNARMR